MSIAHKCSDKIIRMSWHFLQVHKITYAHQGCKLHMDLLSQEKKTILCKLLIFIVISEGEIPRCLSSYALFWT